MAGSNLSKAIKLSRIARKHVEIEKLSKQYLKRIQDSIILED